MGQATAWTLDELRLIDGALAGRGLKIVELDPDETRSQELGQIRVHGDRSAMRYAVCDIAVVRKRRAGTPYVTDCNTVKVTKRSGRVENFHRVRSLHPTLATALADAVGTHQAVGDLVMGRMHEDALAENAARDGLEAPQREAAPQPWVAQLVGREPVDRSGKKKTKRAPAKRKARKPAPVKVAEPVAASAPEPVSQPEPQVATVTTIHPAKPVTKRMTKAERKAWNRTLAAELRSLGFHPNGDVWERAKALKAAGESITRESLAA